MAKARSTGRPSVVTIADVAAAAGVSRATVSRVMNGRETVAPDIAQRVRETAQALQYRPSNVARSLSLGRTNIVALVLPDLANPMFQQILRGVTTAAAQDGYRVLVADSAENPADEAEIALEARLRCDALVLVSPRMPEQELVDLLPRLTPAVVVNRTSPDPRTPSLAVDYAQGIVDAVDHLVALGHEHLVYLSGPPGSIPNELRRAGLTTAGARHPTLRTTVLDTGPTVADGYATAEAVLATRATAVIAFNDLVAFGLLARLNETGVAVPDDVSIVGFDDIELARFATPSLTTVAVPQSDLGHRAWAQLHAVVAETGEAPDATLWSPRLEIRASTGPAPRPPTPGLATPRVSASRTESAGERSGPSWRRDGETTVLELDGAPLARYVPGIRMPAVHAPRPHLHPVRTLAGLPMTDSSPVDHRHHYGVSLAIPDVDGTSHWGGRTYVRDVGPTLLANHGRQAGGGTRVRNDDTSVLHETVRWLAHDGAVQLTEERSIHGAILGDDAWTLRWASVLRADHGPLTIASPGTSGRPGAGYGGLFWRLAPGDDAEVFTADAAGEEAVHGSRTPWLAFAQRGKDVWTTLLLVQSGEPLPWFVRLAAFPGVGPALAWDAPLHVPAGETLRVELTATLVDRRLTRAEAEAMTAR